MGDTGYPAFDATTRRTTSSETSSRSTDGRRNVGSGRIPRCAPCSTRCGIELPVLIRGIDYRDGIRARVLIKMSRDELPAYQPIRDAGEWEDVVSTLPKDVAAMLPAGS